MIAWVLAKEHLETDVSELDVREARSKAQPAWTLLRGLWASEVLPLDAPADGPSEATRRRGHNLRWLFAPETLPPAEPDCVREERTAAPTWLRWLLAREPLPVDEPRAADRPRGLGLRWLFGRDELEDETSTPAPDDSSRPHRI